MEKRKINRFCEVAALVLALAALLTLIGTGLTERVHLGTWGGKTEAVAFLPISPVQGAALLTVLAAVSAAVLHAGRWRVDAQGTLRVRWRLGVRLDRCLKASQLAALCVEAKPGETVIDLCAAPGGKTVLLAEQMQGTGILYSCDAAENRVGLIRTAVDRMGFTRVHTLCNDATKPNPALPMADRILTDVPCSGLGILAKKPDIRYKTLEKARHDELLATQSSILDTAAALLKAGGRLVYSTCTIDPAENEEQVAAFLVRHPEFRVVRPAVAFPDGMTVGEHGALSVPTRTGMDGFFLCAMQKTQ